MVEQSIPWLIRVDQSDINTLVGQIVLLLCPVAAQVFLTYVYTSRRSINIIIILSNNLQHELQLWSLINIPRRKKTRGEKEKKRKKRDTCLGSPISPSVPTSSVSSIYPTCCPLIVDGIRATQWLMLAGSSVKEPAPKGRNAMVRTMVDKKRVYGTPSVRKT